jgi:hypothetical protein
VDTNFSASIWRIRPDEPNRPETEAANDGVWEPPLCEPAHCVEGCEFGAHFLLLKEQKARGCELAALRHTAIEKRFYCWRRDEARYVCSVYPLDEESIVSSYDKVVILGVERRDDGVRPICLTEACMFNGPKGPALRAQALAAGVTEWHVYLDNDPQKVKEFTELFQF